MNLPLILQTVMFGVFVGSLYGVAAVGLALVFGVMRVLNIAHGELMMVAGYITFWAFTLFGLDPFLSLALSVPALFGLGWLLDRVVYRKIHQFTGETKLKNSLLVSFGLVLIFQALTIQFFTADERAIQVSYAGLGVNLGGIVLPYTRIASLLIALATIVGLNLVVQRTMFGRALRAAAEDPEAAGLAGINIQRFYTFSLALSAALAGLAGSLVAIGYGVTPTIGLGWLLRALIVVVLAGTGSILGTFGAGILLGVVEAISGLAFGATTRETVGLIVFLVVLLVRPQGLFGRK
jgi:branched-chain amino acid transport system permease protein